MSGKIEPLLVSDKITKSQPIQTKFNKNNLQCFSIPSENFIAKYWKLMALVKLQFTALAIYPSLIVQFLKNNGIK